MRIHTVCVQLSQILEKSYGLSVDLTLVCMCSVLHNLEARKVFWLLHSQLSSIFESGIHFLKCMHGYSPSASC